jgi:cell division protein FtsI/penicillin-binding protein 2
VVVNRVDANPVHLELITEGLRLALGCQPTGDNAKTPTGCNAFKGFPFDELLLAGKTGTAQGRDSLPEYDSSAFVAYDSNNITQGFTIGAYLEKGGYGGAGSAPLVKCMFLAINNKLAPGLVAPVQISDDLNTAQLTPSKVQSLPPGNDCLKVDADKSSRER